MKEVLKYTLIVAAILFIGVMSVILVLKIRVKVDEGPTPTPAVTVTIQPTKTPTPTTTSTPEITNIPESASITVPFTTQAPLANWDALHQEACEEASLIMLKHFKYKSAIGTKDEVETQIHELVDWETVNGYKIDVTASELKDIASTHYGMKTGRIGTATLDNIKKEIANGRPVIIPAAGRMLDNPNFTGAGPVYHMLVIKGYDKDGFITNDPGTRKGEGFRYTFDNLINAIHDWNQTGSKIADGKKVYLVFD